MIWGSGGSKSRLAKAAGAEPAGQMRCPKSARRCGAKHICKSNCTKHLSFGPLLEVEMSKKCTPLWREAHFPSQNDHFWKLRCRKSARRCGAKHISKSKCAKHTMYGPFLEVQMSKKCTPLWREAYFQVKMYKTHHVRTIFGSSDVVSRGRRKGLWTLSKVTKTWGICSIFNYNHHYTTLHSNTLLYTTTTTTPSLHSTTSHSTTPTTLHSITFNYIQLHYTTLHYTTLHYTTLHYSTLHYLPLHYITLHYITLHYITLHYLPLQYITLHYTPLHYTTLHYTTLHSTTLHYITLHYTPLHYTTPHYTTVHYTSLHYTTLHSTTLQLQLHNYTPLH